MSNGTPADTWQIGNPYERYIGRWSRRVAPAFLAWLGVPAGARWLDVGCGTGALSATILQTCAPVSVLGVDPSEGFLKLAREHLTDARVSWQAASAAALPLADGEVDATVAALVLNFVPDAPAALAEMQRVTAPGGTVAGYVWDYAEGMQLIRHFWDAAVALDPAAAPLNEAVRFPLCQPEALTALWQRSGLKQVSVRPIEVETRFTDFDDYWQPFLGGQGPAPGYVMGLAEPARERLREGLRERLAPNGGAVALTARAWAVQGRVPG